MFLKHDCIENADRGEKGDPYVVFFYYAGHGFCHLGDIHIVCNNGFAINIDNYLRSCCMGRHTKIIAVL